MTTYTNIPVRVATLLTGGVAVLGSFLVAAPAFADYNGNGYYNPGVGVGNVCTSRYDAFCIVKETNYLTYSPYNNNGYSNDYGPGYGQYNNYDYQQPYENNYQNYSYNTQPYNYQYQYSYSYQYQDTPSYSYSYPSYNTSYSNGNYGYSY